MKHLAQYLRIGSSNGRNSHLEHIRGCDTGLATVGMSDVAHCGPRNAQGVCVTAQINGKF